MRQLTFIGLIAVFGLAIWRGQAALAAAGSRLDLPSFLAGIGVTIFFGLIWFRASTWHSSMGRYLKPQTVTLETKETPAKVTLSSICAFFKALGFLVALGFIIAVLLGIVRLPGISPLLSPLR